MIRTIAMALLLLGGCAASDGPDAITVAPGDYLRAFEAAAEAARAAGLEPVFRDPRGGVIETAPHSTPTLLEPWHYDRYGADQLAGATASNLRRRARFEFTPAGAPAAPPDRDAGMPDLLGDPGQPRPSLLEQDGPLELRVRVDVEREHRPGVRRSTWSRVLTTQSVIVPAADESVIEEGPFWVPVVRDERFERRLMADVLERLGQGAIGEREEAIGNRQ